MPLEDSSGQKRMVLINNLVIFQLLRKNDFKS